MKAKSQVVAVLVLAIAAVALLVPVAHAGPGTSRFDANDRAHFPTPVATAAMQDAHQRVGVVSQPLTPVVVDARERQGAQVSTPAPTSSIGDAGFDWAAAAIGASSGLLLALLLGASVLTTRRYRHRPLPR